MANQAKKPKIECNIITASTTQELKISAQHSIDRGWLPCGGPFIVSAAYNDYHSGGHHRIDLHFGWAMVKKHETQ